MIYISNLREMAMPVLVRIEEENGSVQNLKIPVEIWKFGPNAQFMAETNSKILKIELDPEHLLPDTDRSNNVWES